MDKQFRLLVTEERSICEKPELVMISKIADGSFANEWYEIALDNHFWMQWRFFVFKKLLRKANISSEESLHVLEIGCGKGIFLKQMEQCTNWKIDGADTNLEALKDSAAEKSQLLFYDIMEKRKEFKHVYDIVILMDVLEHIEKTQEFLEACLFHLRPDGIIIINVPVLQSMYSVYDEIMGHFRRYNNEKLLKEFNITKISKVITVYWGITLIPLLFLRKLIISRNTVRKDVVKKGFKPPGRFFHAMLKLLMRAEFLFFRNPPIGTSMMDAVFVP